MRSDPSGSRRRVVYFWKVSTPGACDSAGVTDQHRRPCAATSPLYDAARDFLVAICEPVSRPEHVHEWRIDRHALFAAASMGLDAKLILAALDRLSKVPIAQSVAEFITVNTSGYGKVKLVLERGKFFIESAYPAILRLLNKHPAIQAARVRYTADGTRIVGAAAGARGEFEVAAARAETSVSLGLSRVLGEAEGAGDAGARVDGDTAGGTLTARIFGEIDSEDEDPAGVVDSGAVSAAVRGLERGVKGLERGVGEAAAQTGSGVLAELADDFSRLDADDLDMLLDAVDSAEAAYLAEEAAKQAVDEAVRDADSGVLRPFAERQAPTAMRNMLSFRDDAAKMVGDALPPQDDAEIAANIEAATRGAADADEDEDMADGVRTRSAVASARVATVDVPSLSTTPPLVREDAVAVVDAPPVAREAKRARMADDVAATPTAAVETAAAPAPSSTTGGAPKLRLKLGSKAVAAATSASGADAVRAAPVALEVAQQAARKAAAAAAAATVEPLPPPPAAPDRSAQPATSAAASARASRAGVRFRDDDDDDEVGRGDDSGDEDYGPASSDEDFQDAADEDGMDDDVLARRKRARTKKPRVERGGASDVWSARVAKKQDDRVSTMDEFNRMLQALSMNVLHTAGRVERFEIDAAQLDDVKWVCLHLIPPLPMMQEYDFRHDTLLPSLDISLRNPGQLRYYQERSLAKMFGNGRARSGIIVLPCGAGKTLVGIAAASTMAKSTIVLCPNTTSVSQWVEQFKRYSYIEERSICVLTAKHKQALPPLHEAVVLLTTYSMIGSGGKGAESAAVLRAINEREWGLMLLDEVHQAVADTFRRVLKLRAHCRLGLTATLVREDGRDKALSHLIGPKLYEANWLDLTRGDYLANVQVVEVWCPMSPEFYREYLRAPSLNVKKALCVMNPNKCVVMEYLLKYHEALGHKIIVFSESVFALDVYATQYKCIALKGDTPERDRQTFIAGFKDPHGGINKLFLSRVGDVALDVPDANVIIQISSHFGSRLQEAQRMGRILRRGDKEKGTPRTSYFYTLISGDTMETYFANKRRRYLVDQGYAYKVLPSESLLPGGIDELRRRATFMGDDEQRLRMLERVLRENLDEIEGREMKQFSEWTSRDTQVKADSDTRAALRASGIRLGGGSVLGSDAAVPAAPAAQRSTGTLSALSGGEGMRYVEYETRHNTYDTLRAEDAARAAERRATAAAGPKRSAV